MNLITNLVLLNDIRKTYSIGFEPCIIDCLLISTSCESSHNILPARIEIGVIVFEVHLLGVLRCRILKQQDGEVTAFSEKLWCGLLDYATAYADGRLTFTFKNGSTFEG